MNITTWVAILFGVEIAGVFALEVIGRRRVRRRASPVLVIEDDDGQTRVVERPGLGYLSSGLMNLNVRPSTKPAASSAAS
jgi:hypothetical protein